MARKSVPLSSFGRNQEGRLSKLPFSVVIIAAALILPALAPARAQAQRMKLLTPTTGWVSRFGHLYWTTDAGSNWADISPVPPGVFRGGVAVRSVFFLNTQEGWVVVSYPQKVVPLTLKALRTRKTLYQIAQTADGGQTWSFLPLTYPQLPQWQQEALAGPENMFFLDSLHGWLVMGMMGSSNFAPGKLLATYDGGRNWKWVNGPGTIGTLLFTSTQDGWLAGGPGGGNLYVTRNGGGSWEQVNLKTELEGKTVGCGVLGPPHFTDQLHGFLAASCMGQAVVAFATSNTGRTWNAIKELAESKRGYEFPVAITDSTLVVPTGAGPRAVKVALVPLQGEVVSPVMVSRVSALGLTFADRSHGLALSEKGRLLYTANGGATWKDVTPWPMPKPSPLPPGVTVKHPKIEIEVTHPGASHPGDHPAPPRRP